jgi:hypothetical protein
MNHHPLRLPGQWYKGNLHAHTRHSDGELPLEEAVRWHQEHAYDFLAVTDHRLVTDTRDFTRPGFLTIPGIEVNTGRTELSMDYHLIALGIEKYSTPPNTLSVQETIDELIAHGAVVFLAHPYWSGLLFSQIQELHGIIGLEVFNTSCQTDLGKGLSAVHWDDLLARGQHLWGLATDDTHSYTYDAGGGWIVVKAEALTVPLVLRALRAGHFYSTTGPAIHDFYVHDGAAYVSCSPVARINFIGCTQWGTQLRADKGETLTEGSYRLTGKEGYLRVECVDSQGRVAWSNPIYLLGNQGIGGSP